MGLTDTLKGIQEGVERVIPSGEALREAATTTIHRAYDTIRGSGSIRTELGKAGEVALKLPFNMASNALRACGQLLTFQPVEATKTVASGLMEACGNLAKMGTAPVPIALAAAGKALDATKTVVQLPLTAPLAAFGVVKRGVGRVVELMSENRLPASPVANDNANTNTAPSLPSFSNSEAA